MHRRSHVQGGLNIPTIPRDSAEHRMSASHSPQYNDGLLAQSLEASVPMFGECFLLSCSLQSLSLQSLFLQSLFLQSLFCSPNFCCIFGCCCDGYTVTIITPIVSVTPLHSTYHGLCLCWRECIVHQNLRVSIRSHRPLRVSTSLRLHSILRVSLSC